MRLLDVYLPGLTGSTAHQLILSALVIARIMEMGERPHMQTSDSPSWVRNLKDEISRLVLDRFEEAGIQIASGTYDVVGFPPARLEGPAVDRIAAALEERPADAHPERRSA